MGFVLIGIGSFSSLGTSGAMLQMVSHGLIGASLFFLVGATYDRTKTLKLDEMSGVGQKMRIMFALWTACSLASLALPGMSGFVSELMVFTGFVTDEVYTLPFRVVMASLAAIGVILTPIYLLSMLREIFFGKENPKLIEERKLIDAEPREVYIIACLLLPIIGIGLYPRLVTESYIASINNLVDINNLRTAPQLSNRQEKKLIEELEANIFNADWITIGIMAPSDKKAIKALQSISKKYSSIKFGNLGSLHADGGVFLKANQKTSNVFVRSENGLGEGILITCQYDEGAKESNTFGPLPLDFFT